MSKDLFNRIDKALKTREVLAVHFGTSAVDGFFCTLDMPGGPNICLRTDGSEAAIEQALDELESPGLSDEDLRELI